MARRALFQYGMARFMILLHLLLHYVKLKGQGETSKNKRRKETKVPSEYT
jgi:hypothetical protein